MAGIPFKGGFVPVGPGGSSEFSGTVRIYQTSVGAGAIFSGDPVFLTDNGNVVAGLTPTSTTNVIGVAVGGFWIDPTEQTPVESKFVPANTNSAGGFYNGINFNVNAGAGIKVVPKDQFFAVKANTSIPQAALGDRLQVVRTGGSNITGQSDATVSVAGGDIDIAIVADVVRTAEYGTPTSAGGTTVNDWGAPETVIVTKLRNFGEN